MANAQSNALFVKGIYTGIDGTLPYRLLKPDVNGNSTYPLVVFFHGAGERGNDNEAQIKHIQELFLDPNNRKKYPCYVLAPQCARGEMWSQFENGGVITKNPGKSMALAIALIEELITSESIDRSRIYVTGVSMGGFATWDIIARFPGRFAAGIQICGGGDATKAPTISHVPLWVFHGSRDEVVLPRHSRQMVDALRRVGGTPRYTEYQHVGHNCWVNAYREPELLPWLFQHSTRPHSN